MVAVGRVVSNGQGAQCRYRRVVVDRGLRFGLGNQIGLELIPLGQDRDGTGVSACRDSVRVDRDAILDVQGGIGTLQVVDNLLLGDLRVVNGDLGAFGNKLADDGDGRGFAGVAGVLLVSKSKDGDLFARKSVIQTLDDASSETVFLVLVDVDDRTPILGNFG